MENGFSDEQLLKMLKLFIITHLGQNKKRFLPIKIVSTQEF